MSKVLVCDRCGARLTRSKACLIDIKAYRYNFFKEVDSASVDYDLCPACEKAFEEFMKGPTEGSTEKE